MDSFRSDFNRIRKLPDAQAETELRALLTRYPDLSSEEKGEVLYALGLAQFRRNSIAEARDTLQQTCRMFEHAEGAAPALAMTALARVELACGDTSESMATGRAALALLKARLAPEDPRLAPSLFSLSLGEYAARHMAQAEALCLEAKVLWEKQRGPESPEVSTCLNNLGRICEETGRAEEGIAWHRRALAMRRKILGDHLETAFSLGNLGTALAAAGQWEEGAAVLEEALACYARCGHREGGDIDGYRRNLSICREALGR